MQQRSSVLVVSSLRVAIVVLQSEVQATEDITMGMVQILASDDIEFNHHQPEVVGHRHGVDGESVHPRMHERPYLSSRSSTLALAYMKAPELGERIERMSNAKSARSELVQYCHCGLIEHIPSHRK